LSLQSEAPGQGCQLAAGGGLAAALPVSGEDWAAWLLAAAHPQIASQTPPGVWTALTWLARREGYVVRRGECGVGDSRTSWESRQIQVQGDFAERAAARALLHELGHILADGDRFHPPGASTAGCRGIQKLTADSVAFIAAARLGMDESACTWPHVASWAGSDPRAQPEDIIRSASARITSAAARIITHLDITVFGIPPQPATTAQPQPGSRGSLAEPPPPHISRILQDAEDFYLTQLRRSWAPRYLMSRGFGQPTAARWRIGYAPAGWTTLLTHLRGRGHEDEALQAAGVARMSSRGTLIDHFRDRVMVAIRDERGSIVGFIGRARPGADPRTPKYLNSPDSAVFKKGEVLFGLHEAREQLGQGAVPVLVEGFFDAMAVTTAGEQRFAGLAPCGAAFTHHQAEVLAQAADLRHAGVLVALDGDRAGQKGAFKAYEIMRPHTGKVNAAMLPPGRDPAEILQRNGAAGLCAALQDVEPLGRVVIDAHLDQWAGRLDHAEGQLGAMRSAAARIARMLPPETADAILHITGGEPLVTIDENLRPIAHPELPAIARILPADAICQITRTAERTRCEHSEVTAAVANTVAGDAQVPKDVGNGQSGQHALSSVVTAPVRIAADGFPASSAPTANSSPSTTRVAARPRHRAARRPQ